MITHSDNKKDQRVIDCSDPRNWSKDKEPVCLKVGDRFTVKAEENPSTGYTWLLLDQELDYHKLTGVVRQSDSRFEAPVDKHQGMVGVPGTRYLEIEGVGKGEGTLHLVLGRPWEVTEAFSKGEVYQPVGDLKFDIKVTE